MRKLTPFLLFLALGTGCASEVAREAPSLDDEKSTETPGWHDWWAQIRFSHLDDQARIYRGTGEFAYLTMSAPAHAPDPTRPAETYVPADFLVTAGIADRVQTLDDGRLEIARSAALSTGTGFTMVLFLTEDDDRGFDYWNGCAETSGCTIPETLAGSGSVRFGTDNPQVAFTTRNGLPYVRVDLVVPALNGQQHIDRGEGNAVAVWPATAEHYDVPWYDNDARATSEGRAYGASGAQILRHRFCSSSLDCMTGTSCRNGPGTYNRCEPLQRNP